MSARRTVCGGCVTFLLLLAVGCRNNPPATPTPAAAGAPGYSDATHPGPRGPATRPADDDVHGTAEVLAQKATNYARNVEPLLNHRAGPATEPSVAQAIDPDSLILTSTTSDHHAEPPAVANQGAAVAPRTRPAARPNRTGNGPDGRAQVASIEGGGPGDVAGATPPAREELGRKLALHVKEYPQDLAGQLDFQLYGLVNGDPAPQLPVIAGLGNEDRELLAAVIDGVTNFRNAVHADGNLLLSRKVRPILELAERLRSQAELTIPTVALCRKVDAFGVYDPIEPARFVAGREQPVIVYCEVENFASQLDDQKRWATMLAEEVVLYDEQNGLEVWREKQARSIVDHSRNRRHDFFIVKMIKLPANLTIGRYLLKVSVVDQQVQRVAENTVAVEMVAQ